MSGLVCDTGVVGFGILSFRQLSGYWIMGSHWEIFRYSGLISCVADE